MRAKSGPIRGADPAGRTGAWLVDECESRAVNDYELIVAGVARLLSQFPQQLDVCERIIIGDPIDTPIDVALFDTYGRVGIAAPALQLLAETPEISHVAMFSLDLSAELIAEGSARPDSSRRASRARRLPTRSSASRRGEQLVTAAESGSAASAELDWPGKEDGLTDRESQVVVLAAEGLTNRRDRDCVVPQLGNGEGVSPAGVREAHVAQPRRGDELRATIRSVRAVPTSRSLIDAGNIKEKLGDTKDWVDDRVDDVKDKLTAELETSVMHEEEARSRTVRATSVTR